ncbi:hydrolase [Streptacidiphilus pinicola]|uniref:Hydrolase n=1 Tax=Streptacidiphilus pinicola TaxID=2219663 RepID=A0A2X0IMW5_9ACTN|nr:Cof-type HAD-IIB family hydrolase [Streptacidiphilus pinicola]RAG86512.1 hydrolase [Streptacidiphilus pinicola]
MSSAPRPFDLIATDLDGTLLRDDHTVSPRTQRTLEAAKATGAQHIVVTGRSARWTRPTLDSIGYTGLAVCSQGGQLYDAGAHRLVTSVTLDRQVAGIALAKAEAAVGPMAIAVVQDGLEGEVLFDRTYDMPSAGDNLAAPEPVADIAELWAKPLSRVLVQHRSLSDDELAAAVAEAAGGLVTVVLAGQGFVELLPLGLSKATGLALASARLGTTKDRTVAFGDMPNDVPMFRWVGHAVAMANAHPELKAIADEITLSNEEEGVAVALERIFSV